MTGSERQRIFTKNLGLLIGWAYQHDFGLTVGEGWRTDEQQRIYIRTGASRRQRSLHQDRLAHDFNVFHNGLWITQSEPITPLGDYWESLDPDNIWGGRFPVYFNTHFTDGDHFEMNPYGAELRATAAAKAKGDIA